MDLYREPSLRTSVPAMPGHPRFRFDNGLLLWGSCFSEEIGALLANDRFQVRQNPFGIVYNPMVMANQIDRLLDGRKMEPEELFFDGELWHSPWHHGSFSDPDRDKALDRMNSMLADSRQFLLSSTHLVLTWGHTQVFTDRDTGLPVANCHKRPSRDFLESHLHLEQLVPAWQSLLEKLHTLCPKVRTIITISPVRYLRNGAPAHSRSKATLHLLAERLENLGAAYFPSWEIMQDELRDYRFYASDLIHPTPMATGIIYGRFLQAWFDSDQGELLQAVREWVSMAGHRPLFPGTPSHQKLLASLQAKKEDIERRWPDQVELIGELRPPDSL